MENSPKILFKKKKLWRNCEEFSKDSYKKTLEKLSRILRRFYLKKKTLEKLWRILQRFDFKKNFGDIVENSPKILFEKKTLEKLWRILQRFYLKKNFGEIVENSPMILFEKKLWRNCEEFSKDSI